MREFTDLSTTSIVKFNVYDDDVFQMSNEERNIFLISFAIIAKLINTQFVKNTAVKFKIKMKIMNFLKGFENRTEVVTTSNKSLTEIFA